MAATDEVGQVRRADVLPTVARLGRSDELVWSDSSARAVLQLMVEAVAEMIGFEVAALSVVLGDQLVTVAYTGPEEFRAYLEEPDPVSVLDPILERAETWGRFLWLAAEDYDASGLEGHWVIMSEPGSGTDAWDPHDVLLGLLHDDDRLVGVLSVDRPVDGCRPDARQRRLLEKYAAQAERAVITAFEREALVQQVAHAESARRLIRSASMPAQASLEAVLHHTHGPLVEGFGAAGSWIEVLDPRIGYARGRRGEAVDVSEDVIDLARLFAPRLWERQEVLVVGPDLTPREGETRLEGEALERALAEMARVDAACALAVALGAGPECLGLLSVFRRRQDPPWSSAEVASLLQIGHDLGAALMTARALEGERALVRELQLLEDHRTQLISTLSHELRTPLTVIAGNLELLGALDLGERGVRIHGAMKRGTTRMQQVVDDLLLLATVSDPQHPLQRQPVDLRTVVVEVAHLVETPAKLKHITLDVELAPASLVVPGDPTELDRLLTNLLSNAVKYTPEGGHVTVSGLQVGDQVVLRVRDNGLGISEEDQAALFGAFFRSTNPVALREQGTGLGLTIVSTVVGRHGGRLEVESALGEGTTFTVTLPADPADQSRQTKASS